MSDARHPLKALLVRNYDYLVDELMVPLYVDTLFSHGIVSSLEKDELADIRSRHKQAKTFIDSLLRKGEAEIDDFLKIVKNAPDKQPHIYDELMPSGHVGIGGNAVAANGGGLHPQGVVSGSSSGSVDLDAEVTPIQIIQVGFLTTL